MLLVLPSLGSTPTKGQPDDDPATQRLSDAPKPGWAKQLETRLLEVDSRFNGELGVYVKDLDTSDVASLRADEYWYLASGIKVPVAIAVMRAAEAGTLSLDTELTLSETDYVDGAGQTNWNGPGSRLNIRYLMEQMLTDSDNTATDMLIRKVGIGPVNAVARELAPRGLGDITTLADVRRHAYSGFHPDAFRLGGLDFFALKKQSGGTERIAMLAELLELDPAQFAQRDLDSAFERYYRTRLNSGLLSAFGELLEKLVTGQALGEDSTAYLNELLLGVRTGTDRISAGLPEGVGFAHKTGTQHRRACDLGVVFDDDGAGRPLAVVTVCARGFLSLDSAETAMRSIGEAVTASGVLNMQ